MLNSPTGIFAYWSDFGDVTKTNMLDNSKVTITFMFATVSDSLLWITTKFWLRFALSLLILFVSYRSYYHHIRQLTSLLERYPLSDTSVAVSYGLIIGEPTSLVICNPFIIIAFIFDFWCCKLFRSVWFPYGAMVLVNGIIKCSQMTPLLHPISTTTIAIVSFIYACAITLWHSIQPDNQNEYFSTQGFPFAMIYSISLCGMPFMLSALRVFLKHIYRFIFRGKLYKMVKSVSRTVDFISFQGVITSRNYNQ
ncbi:hypothetical protein THRCLA_22913, partial [Thraustotheca clavata]